MGQNDTDQPSGPVSNLPSTTAHLQHTCHQSLGPCLQRRPGLRHSATWSHTMLSPRPTYLQKHPDTTQPPGASMSFMTTHMASSAAQRALERLVHALGLGWRLGAGLTRWVVGSSPFQNVTWGAAGLQNLTQIVIAPFLRNFNDLVIPFQWSFHFSDLGSSVGASRCFKISMVTLQ